MACAEAEAVCCHNLDRGLEGRRPMVTTETFVLDGVKEDITHAQLRGLLLCFGQRNHCAAHRPTNADDREHTPGFLG